jgi:two-component system, LytTR family, response regulator
MDMSIRVLIIEDEAPARATLLDALGACGVAHTVVGEASGCAEAVQLMDRLRPDVVLLDIRLGDGTGFEVLERAAWKNAQVIFITAYDQYAIRAFRYAAVDYLLKPVEAEQLGQALKRLRADDAPAITIEALLKNLARPNEERIVVPCAEGIHVLEPRAILRCEADGNYTHLHTTDGERLVAARTLKDFEELLAPHRFERVHMSYLVNLMHVRKFLHRDGGVLVLTDGSQVPVVQRRRQQTIDSLARK